MKICKWSQTGDEFWESPCGVAWEFTTGTPYANGMRFCLRCGKPMFLKRHPRPLPSRPVKWVVKGTCVETES